MGIVAGGGNPLTQPTDPEPDIGECSHLDQIRDVTPSAEGCEECLRIGSTWVHLRLCLTCGRVGCCDSSPNQHASGHVAHSGHPIVRSLEPGEDWAWCYVDELVLEPASPQPAP
jgi:uncharacterized UBP type Zn finger protein